MQRNQNPGQNPRNKAERDASQPLGGQPRTDDEDDELQDPNQVPSFLTAQELQAKDPAKGSSGEAGERDAFASSRGERGQPPIDDDEPPRADREKPMKQTDRMLKKGGK